MRLLRTLAAVLLALPVAAAADAQTPAITGYVDADGYTTRRDIAPTGWGFMFRPTSDIFVAGLSVFNPEASGGGAALGGPFLGGQLATSYLVSIYELSDTEYTGQTWATEELIVSAIVDNTSAPSDPGLGILGAFWTTMLTQPARLDARTHYGVAAHPLDGEHPWYIYQTPRPAAEIGYIYDGIHSYAWGASPDWFSDTPSIQITGGSFVYVTAVPEPSTLLLVAGGLGLVGMAALRRKRPRA